MTIKKKLLYTEEFKEKDEHSKFINENLRSGMKPVSRN